MRGNTGLLIGIGVSIVGSTISNFGQNVQKYAQTRNDELPEDERKESYTSLWRWWAGSAEAQPAPCWRFEIEQGDGRASSRGDDPTFTFAPGAKRGHNDAQPSTQGGLLEQVWEQIEDGLAKGSARDAGSTSAAS